MFKDKIYEMLTPETKSIIQEFKEEPLRKIVYTSFDGDDMHHILAICNQVLMEQMIPLNPKMALGYYISTQTLGGNKINVMTDCLTLTLLFDKLWIYGKNDILLSEGIMAEAFLWSQIKNKKVTFVPNIYNNEKIVMNYLEVKDWLLRMTDESFRNDLFYNLLTPYKNLQHKTVYIGANFVNYKHIDWARVQAYKEKLCPISPQNILSYFLYHNLKDRLTLLSKSDLYWLCIDTTNLEEELNRLDQNKLAELYMLNTVYINTPVKIVDWSEIKGPKYDKTTMWALTKKEQVEILGKSWPLEFRK